MYSLITIWVWSYLVPITLRYNPTNKQFKSRVLDQLVKQCSFTSLRLLRLQISSKNWNHVVYNYWLLPDLRMSLTQVFNKHFRNTMSFYHQILHDNFNYYRYKSQYESSLSKIWVTHFNDLFSIYIWSTSLEL